MISVIMPTFNREKTIMRAIDSVLNQDYKDIELIIVDDCSTDNTEKIIKKLDDKRIRYYKLKKNSGANFARNYGIKKARGEYISFQDSDDEWLNGKLTSQLNYLLEKDADICFTSYLSKGYKKNDIILPDRKYQSNEINRILYIKSIIGTPTIMAKKECFQSVSFDIKMPKYQEWDLMIRMSEKYKIVHLNKVYHIQYVQSDSISINQENSIKAIEMMLEKKYNFSNGIESLFKSYKYKQLAMHHYLNHDDINICYECYKKAFKYKKTFKNFILYLISKLKMKWILKLYLK